MTKATQGLRLLSTPPAKKKRPSLKVPQPTTTSEEIKQETVEPTLVTTNQSANSSGGFSSDHLLKILVDDAPGSGFQPGGDAAISDAPGQQRLTKDEFFATFKMLFAIPNMVPVAPLPIASLPIKPEEELPARAASDAVYEIAADTPYMRWLIEPGSEWMQRLMAIGIFVFGKGSAIVAELAARGAPPPKVDVPNSPKETRSGPAQAAPEGDASTITRIAA